MYSFGGNAGHLTVNTADGQEQLFSGNLGSTAPNLALTKAGSGTLSLTGANTYSEGTTVNAGTLALGHTSALGANTGNLMLNGGTLDLGTYSPAVGTVFFNGGTFTNGTLDNATAFEVGTGSLSANLGGVSALTKSGPGAFTLSGNNTRSGGTTVRDGTLSITDTASLGSGPLSVAHGGTLNYTGNIQTTLSTAATFDGAGSAFYNGTCDRIVLRFDLRDGDKTLSVLNGASVTEATPGGPAEFQTMPISPEPL